MALIQDYIEIREGVRSGKSVFKGTRITVADILEQLAAGQSEAEILEDFPKLTHEHILAAYQYAALRERGTSYSAA